MLGLFNFFFVCVLLGIKSGALCMLGEGSRAMSQILFLILFMAMEISENLEKNCLHDFFLYISIA
jgi:hypothetical protein